MDSATLRGDCARCVALCCVALAFDRSSEFAFDKAAGVPCPHLGAEADCRIHAHLEQRGFRGCARYDCAGAGQRVTQLFGRDDERMFEAFRVAREIHTLLQLVVTAERLPLDAEQAKTRGELQFALENAAIESFESSGLELRTRTFLHGLRGQVRRLRIVA